VDNLMTEIILESISDGVFTVDLNWKITFFNKAAERITGIKRSNAVGKLCCEVFKSSMCESACPLRKTLKTGKTQINKSGYIVDLKGHRIPVSVSTALLVDKEGKTIGGAETFRDLSEIEEMRNELKAQMSFGDMSSSSRAMIRIFELLPAISDSASTVLIQGETGTGKELLARTIHALSSRAKNPFIAINCGALPDTLLESELFGYKKGAFTGADKDKPGRFALAENGTLFLDEIGDISSALQVKLLRVLQEREYEPLGSTRSEKTNARIVCSTNRNLQDLVNKRNFRQDLFYRINIISIELPPLRKRREDIPNLAERFLNKFNRFLNKTITGFSPEVYSLFYSYDWPGNIRELENVIERAVVICSKKVIELEFIPPEISGNPIDPIISENIRNVRNETEKMFIVRALKRNFYNRAATARDIGIDKATLYRKIKSYDIQLPKQDGRSSIKI